MNKRQICLLIAALVTLSAMLIVSAALTDQSAVAQTPTPTPIYWIDCVAGYYYTDGSSQHSWQEGAGIAYTSDLTGVINVFDSWNLPSGAGADMSMGGCNDADYAMIHGPGGETDYPVKCCDRIGGAACTAMGYSYDGVINQAIIENGIANGGTAFDKPGAWWNSHVCAIYWSPPPTLTLQDCSGDIISNTHFVIDDWTKSGTTWRWSEYDIAANGSIRKNGTFSSTGTYSVSILARSQWPNHMYACLGSECTEPITISDGAYQWYSAGVTVTTVGAHEVFLYASPGNSAQAVTADQICIHPISTTMLSACGVVQDYHFVSPTSWSGSTGSTWNPTYWSLRYAQNIQQTINVTMAGMYSATLSARCPDCSTTFIVYDNGVQVASVDVESSSYATYSASPQLTLGTGSHTIKLMNASSPFGSADVDWFCVFPSVTSSYGPCGITSADMANSKGYIIDPTFDEGFIFPKAFANGLYPGYPIGLGFGIDFDTSYSLLMGDWSIGSISPIFLDWWAPFHGMLRHNGSVNNRALGIIPLNLHTGIETTKSLPRTGFNFVYRMNRKFSNARLLVNGSDQCSDTGYGSWIQNSIYFPSVSSIHISADCSGEICTDPIADTKAVAVDIDDTYIVPGPAIPNCECVGGTLTPPAPVLTGTCINANPQFADTSSWRTVGGASILTSGTGGWARIPGGSFIEQDIPVATAGTTWGNLQTSLVVGMTYVVQTAAHLESATEAGQYSVIMGASSPGQVRADHQIVPPAQYSSINSDSVTISADMAGDGENPTALLRIANEAGGTVLMDTVCVQPTGTGGGAITTTGPCLGTWTLSSGGTAIGVPIAGNDYVQDDQQSMYGSYVLDVSGEQAQDINTLRVSYNNNGTGNYDNVGVFDVVGYAFVGQISFVVPPGGYYNGALQIVNDDDLLEYTNICLRAASGPTPNPHPPNDPGTLPIPACGSVNSPYTNTTGFYQLAPYAISEEYSGTAPVIIAGLTYNYAIYPLVCTTISIANWQYNAYTAWIDKFNLFASRLSAQLDEIIALLEAILAAIPDMIIPPTCGILDVILWLLKIFLTLFLKFMTLFAQGIQLVISIFQEMMTEIRGDSAVQYPFSCSGDGYWLCFALAGILSVQNQVGDWFNIIALIVCSMLTVSLVFWTVNQIRGMAQPGTEEGPSE